MPEILRVLRVSGISDDAVTIIVGTGMHRPSTPEEHEELLGPGIVARREGMCLALPALHEDSKLLLVSACTQQLGSPEYTDLMRRYSRGRWRQFQADAAARTDVTEKDQRELQEVANVRPVFGEEPDTRSCLKRATLVHREL